MTTVGGSPEGADIVPLRPGSTRDRLAGLRRDIQATTPDADMLAVVHGGPGAMRRRVSERMEQVVANIHGIYATNVQMSESGVWNGLLGAALPRRVPDVIAALSVQLPTPEEMIHGVVPIPRPAARYINRRTNRDRDRIQAAMFSVNVPQIDQDIQELSNIANTHPQHAEDIQGLIRRLDQLRGADQRSAVLTDIQDRITSGRTEEGMNKMGRMAIILAAGAAALLSGVLNLRQGTFSLVTALYAAVALYAANPNLLQGRERRVVQSTGALVHSESYLFMAARIPATDMETLMQTIRTNSAARREVARAIPRGRAVTREGAERAARALAPGDEQLQLREALVQAAMADRDKFLGFIENVQALTGDPMSQQLVGDYTRNRAWSLRPDAATLREQAAPLVDGPPETTTA